MHLAPLLRQFCPRCRQGRVFSGFLRMNPSCLVCDLPFQREQGYFIGAMYFSYAIAVAVATPLVIVGLANGWSYPLIGILDGVLLVALTPWIFRYSRVIWIHFDQYFDPSP